MSSGKEPNPFAVLLMDHVFTPIEQNDWRVERIDIHPQEWERFKESFGPEHLDLNAVPELLKAGHMGSL